MFKISHIIIILFVSILSNVQLKADSFNLKKGYYAGSLNKDSIEVDVNSEKIKIIFDDGSIFNLNLKNKNEYYMGNLSNDGGTMIRVLGEEKFQISYVFNNFCLSKSASTPFLTI